MTVNIQYSYWFGDLANSPDSSLHHWACVLVQHKTLGIYRRIWTCILTRNSCAGIRRNTNSWETSHPSGNNSWRHWWIFNFDALVCIHHEIIAVSAREVCRSQPQLIRSKRKTIASLLISTNSMNEANGSEKHACVQEHKNVICKDTRVVCCSWSGECFI